MIARSWRGAVRPEDAEAYAAYIDETGMKAYAATPGNRGAWMLQRPVRAMGSGLFDKNAPIAQSLVELRRTVEDLDPSRQGPLSKKDRKSVV